MGKHGVIGLDLGSKTIKAVEIEQGRDHSLIMTRAAVHPTPEGMIVDGYIIDTDMIAMEITAMLAENGFTAKRAVLCCAGQTDMVVRVTEVPRMSPKDLQNAMRYDLERHLPFPPADARDTVQYAIYDGPDADPNSPNMEITITALKDEACERQLSILSSAKLKPVALDAEPFAIGRALVTAVGGSSEGCIAIVNIGSERTDIHVIHHDRLRFTRSIPMAGNTFTTAVSQGLIVEASEAETMKLRYAHLSTEVQATAEPAAARPQRGSTAPPRPAPADAIAVLDEPPLMAAPLDEPAFGFDEGPPMGVPEFGGDAADEGDPRPQVAQALRPVVAELANEINRSLEYYRTRHDDVDVTRVILVGGSALIPNLAPVVEQELGGVPTEIGDPFCAVAPDPEGGYTPDRLAYMAPVVATAVGLALHEWY